MNTAIEAKDSIAGSAKTGGWRRPWFTVMMVAGLLLASVDSSFAAAKFVAGLVPDWNQPYRYTAASPNGGPGPDPAPNVANQWNAWCAPCSAANLAGHWSDFAGVPAADTTAFAGSTVMWAAGPSWQDHEADGFARPAPQAVAGPLPTNLTDVGWYMDSNRGHAYDLAPGSMMGGYFFGNGKHAGTYLKDIHAGLGLYLNARSNPAGWAWVTGTQGIGFAGGTNALGLPAVQHNSSTSAFAEVVYEIDRDHTLVLSYRFWNIIPSQYALAPAGREESSFGGAYYTWGGTPGPGPTNAEDETWNYGDSGTALGHAVTAVGYIRAGDADDKGLLLGLGPTDWVIVHDNWSSTPRNVIVPFGYNGAWIANTTAVPERQADGEDEATKWLQPPDCEIGLDVESIAVGIPQQLVLPVFKVADDWLCDGRPITAIRWWGSYLGWLANVPDVNVPPMQQPGPWGFRLTWYNDVPAQGELFSRPGEVIKQAVYMLGTDTNPVPGVVLQQPYCVSDLSGMVAGSNVYEHEFSYYVQFPEAGAWLEKEGVVYWLGIEALYLNPPESFQWGWKTTPLSDNWNDDAVMVMGGTTNELTYPPPGWQQITNHPYAGRSVNMAFELLTDVCPRRTRKWAQPPDMVHGENLASYTVTNGQMAVPPTLRADDFISDGRRITDIHWWGSYLGYSNMVPVNVPPPSGPDAPVGFWLSWHADLPADTPDGEGYSMPAEPALRRIFVPLGDCHQMYYGTVTQFWDRMTYEHEYQYYVDLLGQYTPWNEQSGTVYWLDIQAVFTNAWLPGREGGHTGWGWKTTPPENQWNDFSVVATNPPSLWYIGRHTPGHFFPNQPCDLSFELTTDQVGGGTNWWNQPIIFQDIDRTITGTPGTVMSSVGDAGAGVQVLQVITNMAQTNSWADVCTNAWPLPAPYTNNWQDMPATETAKFYRVLQR